MSVRAKFLCQSVQNFSGNSNITLEPVRGGNTENDNFYKLTPGGSITLQCIVPEVAASFVPGSEYYIDFTPAVGVPSSRKVGYSPYQTPAADSGITPTEAAVLQCMTARWDGDVESKRDRSDAAEKGWIARHNGFNVVTVDGLKMLLERGLIHG